MPVPQMMFMEDDADDRDFLEMALHRAHPQAKGVFARNGAEGISYLANNPDFTPDAIFLDMNMPVMGGKESLEKLRKLPRLQQVPIYVYSTTAPESLVSEMLQLGAHEFLLKPSSMDALTGLLQRVLTTIA